MNHSGPLLSDSDRKELARLELLLQETTTRIEEIRSGARTAIPANPLPPSPVEAHQLFTSWGGSGFADESNQLCFVLNALPAHVALLDDTGGIVSVNEAWRRFATSNLLRNDSFCVGTNYIEVCEAAHGQCAEEAKAVAAGIREVLAGARSEFTLDYPCHSPDVKRWFRFIVSALTLDGGVGAIVMHLNITDQKLSEAALRDSEERFRLTFLDAAIGIAICSTAGHFLQVNTAYCRMLGYSEAELGALDFAAITAPEDRAHNLALVKELLDGKIESFVIVKRYLGKMGNVVWCRVSVSAQRDDNNAPVNLIAVAEDITRQREAEGELTRSQALLHMATQVSRLGAWSIEIADGTLSWSGDESIFPDMPADFAFNLEGALAICAPEYRDRVADAFVASVEHGEVFDVEFEVVGGSGNRSWVRSMGEPVFDTEGNVVRVQGAFQDITALKNAELRERQLADQLAMTLESITDAFFMLDTAWTVTYMNGSAELLLKRSRGDLVGRNLWTEFPEAVGSVFELQYHRAVAERVPVEFEQYFAPLDRWFGVRAFPIPEGLAVYFQDVSESRRVRDDIQASEERFRLLSKATNDAIWEWDLQSNNLWWNEGFELNFGFQRDQIESTVESWTTRIHPDERDTVYPGVLRSIDNGEEHWSAEYRFQRKDGSYAYVLDRGHIIRGANGKPLRMVGGITDLTALKEVEARLAEQAALLDMASDAIMVRDLDQKVLYWNRGAQAVYGWSAEEVIGKPVSDFLYRNPKDLLAAEAVVLRDGEWSGEVAHLTKEGEIATVFGRWTLVRDAAGGPKGVLTINTDITRRKSLEHQFLRAQRMESIGTLAGGIAHDLNNVLAPILLAVDILQERIHDEPGKAMVETVRKCAQRGADLIKQVLTFARGEEGRRLSLNVRHIARDVQQIVYDTFPRNIECEVISINNLWSAKADPTQLHQVLMNLCVNARDAMPEGGKLSIALDNYTVDELYSGMNMDALPGRYVKIQVSDTGMGIPKEVQDRIFEPFFTTKDVGKGTGLGLSTTFTIVQDHGGFINVYSELGKGAMFAIYIPAIPEEDRAETAEPVKSDLPRGNGELILLVDDEEGIRDITKRALERFGYRVLVAENGAEGVSLYVQNEAKIAVVITDMSMPVMDGPAMIVALKSINPRVHIIGSSGLADNGQMAKLAGAEVEYFVPKPYTAAALLRLIHQILTES